MMIGVLYILHVYKEHGAIINKENNNGRTPLYFACQKGHDNIVKYLVEYWANINEGKSNEENNVK